MQYGTGSAPSDICEANLKTFHINRLVARPNGTYTATVWIELWGAFNDEMNTPTEPNYPHTFDVTLEVSNPSQGAAATPLAITPLNLTTENACTDSPSPARDLDGDGTPEPGAPCIKVIVETNADGIGSESVPFSVEIPDGVNATGRPYELVAKIQVTRPDDPQIPGPEHAGDSVRLYDTTAGWTQQGGGSKTKWLTYADTPGCSALGQWCHCAIGTEIGDADSGVDFACTTRRGSNDIDELPAVESAAMRFRNGDLCIIPNGEDSVALGYLDGTPYDYAGRFIGGFLNDSPTPSPTQADFRNRRVVEFLQSPWLSHSCYDTAVSKGFNPDPIPCPRTGPQLTYESAWNVVPPQSPANHHGLCTTTIHVDKIGFNNTCAQQYAEVWDAGDPAPCQVTNTQSMKMYCRYHGGTNGKNDWLWMEQYESAHDLGWSLDSVVSPASYQSWRDGVYTTPRTRGSAPVCTDPGWGSTN